jgi:hypothetical protein
MTQSEQSPQQIVAQADRVRRGRFAHRLIASAAPIVAAVLLVMALAGRFFGWSRFMPVAGLVLAAVSLAVYAWFLRRKRPTSDAMASRVDQDAALRGELRSAHWFEANGPRDEWAEYHLKTATDRAANVDWATLYPAVKSGRQWVGAVVMAVAVVGVSLYVPARATSVASTVPGLDPALAAALPPDLAKKLAALMAQLSDEALAKDAKQMSLEEMKALMAKLDPALQKKLEEMLAKAALKQGDEKTALADARPERAENATAGLPEDVRWAQEDMAQRMAQASQDRQTNPSNPSASSETGEKGAGSAQAEQQQAMGAQGAQPLVREAATDPGGKMMMGGGGPMGGDSRPGAGGNQGAQQGAAEALLLQALKKDTLEAAADALGQNVDKEDIRKKTEQGKSSLGFTRVAAAQTFDPSRAAAPPPVPEARRQLLLNYFIRKK